MAPKRVLSIQSHVVSGYVGNKAAVFPLQLLGFDVDVINSVQFSNHSQYPNGKEGDVLKGDQLQALLDGLERNDLLADIGHVLTGYIGSASFLEAFVDVIRKVRQHSSHTTVRYVCDPVLGDHGRFYVPPELVPLYRDVVLPLADVVTPNQFEVEQLTGIVIHSMDDALRACRALHELGPPLVFITSIQFRKESSGRNESETVSLPASTSDSNNIAGSTVGKEEEYISILASERRPSPPSDVDANHDNATDSLSTNVWTIECPVIMGHFTGTGDLTAALLLGHSALLSEMETTSAVGAANGDMARETNSAPGSSTADSSSTSSSSSSTVPAVLEKVVNTMFAVIQRTAEQSGPTIKSRELQLIASKHVIEHPPQRFQAKRVIP